MHDACFEMLFFLSTCGLWVSMSACMLVAILRQEKIRFGTT